MPAITYRPPTVPKVLCGASVWVDFRLDNSLNGSQGNTHGSAFVRIKKRNDQRELGKRMAERFIRAHGISQFPDGWVLELVRVAPSSLDDDNVVGSFKSIRDGFADGFKFDDGASTCWWTYHQIKSKRKSDHPYMVMAVLLCTACWMHGAYGVSAFNGSSRKKITRCPHAPR